MATPAAVFFDVDFTLIHPGPRFQGVGYEANCARHGVAVDQAAFDAAVAGAASALDLEAADGEFLARRHTISVQPAQRVSFLVTADALGGWAWHCHILYHMDAGMFREVVVS